MPYIPYQKTNWVNEETQLSASNFNNMEAGIENASNNANEANLSVDKLKEALDLNLSSGSGAVNTSLNLTADKTLQLTYGIYNDEDVPQRTLSIDLTPVVSDLNLGVQDVKVNGLSIVDNNNTANITIPTKISDLQDDRKATRILITDDASRMSELQEHDLLFLVED